MPLTPVQRFAYAAGRAIGAAGHGFLTTMWPRKTSPAEAMRPDIPDPRAITYDDGARIVPPYDESMRPNLDSWNIKYYSQPVRDTGVEPLDESMDWFGWSVPTIAETLTAHEFVDHPLLERENHRGMCACMTSAHNPIDGIEWVDHVSRIVAEKLACDPARAIAALWNYELSKERKNNDID